MSGEWRIEDAGDLLLVRIAGAYSGIEAAETAFAAIAGQCRSLRRSLVLIDLTALTDTVPPRDRFLLGKRAARLWGRRIKVAILAKPEEITHFFENVAVNEGANVRVFADPEAARAWLQTGTLA